MPDTAALRRIAKKALLAFIALAFDLANSLRDPDDAGA